MIVNADSRAVRLGTELLPTPGVLTGGDAPGQAEVEWTLSRLAPMVAQWPEAPPALVEALRSGTDPSTYTAVHAGPGTQPKRGLITAFPLYCALWSQPLEKVDIAGRVAQAAVLVSAAILQGGPNGLAPYAAALGAACLSCRRVGSDTHVPRGLAGRLASAASLEAVLDALGDAKRSVGLVPTDEQIRLLAGLQVLVEDALHSRQPRTHRNRTAHRQVRRAAGSPEMDDPAPEHQIYVDPTARAPSDHELAEGAAGVSEAAARRVATVKVSTSVPATSLSPGQLHWRAKYRARAISTSSQGLLLASDRLQLVDLVALQRAMADLQAGRWRLSEQVRKGSLVVAASLLLGRPSEKLKSLAIVPRIDEVPNGFKDPVLAVADTALVVSAPDLPNSFIPEGSETAAYRSVTGCLALKLPEGFSWTDALLAMGRAHPGTQPFSRPDCVAWAQQFVTAVNSRHGSRLTLPRIAQFLTRQVVTTCGDWADAAILSGGGDADARLYYYAPAHAHLQERYAELWDGVRRGLGLPTEQLVAAGAPSSPSEDTVYARGPAYIGSRGCPTDVAVREMVHDLIRHCRSALRGRRSASRVKLVHNAVALYTCLMVFWHAGLRAVSEPVELALYDRESGVMGVSDKDNDSYYASRVVWLPPLVQRQIDAYWRHLGQLQKALPRAVAPRGKGLFFFDAKGEISAITMQALRSVLPSGYPFRLNAQRHYLRTRLRELGVPAQTIDALLGHGAPGQEPYAAHSCYSAARMRRELEPAIQVLSEGAGWVLLQGLGA